MTQKERIMRNLGVSADEANKILQADRAIDHGERMEFDLTPEQEKQAKKFANTGTRSTEKKTVRKAPENPTKEGVITAIFNFLSENGYESVEITNKTRQISFILNDQQYELTLIAKRKAK